MSFGKGGKSTQSGSQQQWDYGNRQDPYQQMMMQNMWGAGQNLANSGAGMAAGQQGYDQGMGYLGQAMGGLGQASQYNQQGMDAMGQGMRYNQQAMAQAGSPYMTGAQNTLSRLQNPGLDPMMAVYGRQIGQQFNEQVMPGLRGDAMVAGGLGGSRAGIGQGLAGARMGQQLQDFGAQLYGQNQDRALAAAGQAGNLQNMIAGIYGQGAGMAGQLGQGMMQGSQNQQAISGMYGQGSQQAQALGQYGMGIPWYAQQQMAGLLGPAIMQNLGGYGTSASSGKSGGGWNLNTGFSFGR